MGRKKGAKEGGREREVKVTATGSSDIWQQLEGEEEGEEEAATVQILLKTSPPFTPPTP